MTLEGTNIIQPNIENLDKKNNTRNLTFEYLKNLSTIEIEASGNFIEVLNSFNTNNNLNLQQRADGLHVTIISPTESKVLSTLNPEQIENLEQINNDIQLGVVAKPVGTRTPVVAN